MKNRVISQISEFCGFANEDMSNDTRVDDLSNGITAFDDYLNYRYFDEESQLFISSDNLVGFMVEIAPIVGIDDGLYKNLEHFFNDELPNNSYLQFLLVASHDVDNILQNWKSARTNPNEFLQKCTRKRAEFIKEKAVSFGASDGTIARDYRIFINFSQIIDKDAGYAKIKSFKSQFLNKLDSLQLAPRLCDASDLIKLVRNIVQMELKPQGNIKYDKLNLISKQILSPAQIHQVTQNEITHLSTKLESRCYHIKELPTEFSLAQTINLLGDANRSSMGIAARFIISYSIASDISNSGQQALIAQGKKVIASSEKSYANGNRSLQREASEWKDVIDRASNGERILTEHWGLMITAPIDSIDIVAQSAIGLYNVNNFRLELTNNLQLPSLLSILPFQQAMLWNSLKKFKLTRLVLSKEVVARLPIHAEWRGVPKSGILMHAKRGQLFNFNPYYKISSGNSNICFIAPSGGGKSVCLQELAICLMAQDTRMFILDIGQSFANLCTLVDGEMIRFGRASPFSLNPFASFHEDMNVDDRDEFLKCTKSLMEVMCSVGDDARGSADLEKAIVKALEQSNYKLDITSFAEYLETCESKTLQKYGATLYPYTKDGLYGKYFFKGETATFKRLITVFEFEEIKNEPKLLSIVLQILLMQVTNQFLCGDRQTPFMIIVDEAWMLLDFAAKFFAAFVRTVRKYGGALVTCVQNFMDLQKSQDHKTILENSTWTILLKQDEKGLHAFKESEAFKDMIPLIRSISLVPNKYAECLIYTTGVTVIGRLILDDYSNALYSTDANDFNFLNTRVKQGLTLDNAIDELALKKRPKNIGQNV